MYVICLLNEMSEKFNEIQMMSMGTKFTDLSHWPIKVSLIAYIKIELIKHITNE